VICENEGHFESSMSFLAVEAHVRKMFG